MEIDYKIMKDLISYNKNKYYHFKNYLPFETNNKLEKLLKARYNKVSRIKQHFIYMFHRRKHLYFLTFTFDQKRLNQSDRTKKDLIKKCLKSFDDDIYIILNIDYGSQTERPHYHCIVGFDSDKDFFKHIKNNYPCFTWIQPIYFNDNGFKKIPKYLNKLSNHAVKASTHSSRIYFNFKGYGCMSVPEVKNEYLEDLDCVGL